MLLAYIYADVDKTFFLFMFTVLIQIENFQRKKTAGTEEKNVSSYSLF